MNRAKDVCSSTVRMRTIISLGLHKINLAAHGPRSVHRLLWHHPNSWPKPIALGELRSNLDTTIFDALLALCIQARGTDWGNNRAGGLVGADAAGSNVLGIFWFDSAGTIAV